MQNDSLPFTQKNYDTFEWIQWVDPSSAQLQAMASTYDLELQLVEDSLQEGHLPKWEETDNYHFLIVRSYTAPKEKRGTSITQLTNKVAIFYNKKRVITIHKSNVKLKDRQHKTYRSPIELVLSLIKESVRTYEEPTHFMSDKVDVLEQNLFTKNGQEISMSSIYYLKTRTRLSRNILAITQNVLNVVEVDAKFSIYLQDIQDEILNLLVSLDDTLDNANNLLSTYISVNNQQNNNVMKLLTVISVFFLPLTFISSIYGMNFVNMPELEWQYGYFLILGVMLLLAIGIYWWFKRKKII